MSRVERQRKARRRWLGLFALTALVGWFWSGRTEALNAQGFTQDPGPKGSATASDHTSAPAHASLIPSATIAANAQGRALSDWLSPLHYFPAADTVRHDGRAYEVTYGVDSLMQQRALYYMKRFRPEGGALLVCDLESGQLLAAIESDTASIEPRLRLALKATYPAASLAKIITASAGLNHHLRGPEDSLWQLGANHTLYRSQLKTDRCGNCPKVALREAFARSINPAFAVLGLKVGSRGLQTEAERFGFNAAPLSPFGEISRYAAPDSGFHLAEVACGFTANSTISPLHALQIARAIGDDGRLLAPILAPQLLGIGHSGHLTAPYGAKSLQVADRETLLGLQDLMEATTRSGTARKGFHRAMRAQELDKIISGGKTGSLDGHNPKGRYEWFIGYVRLKDDPRKGLALAVMLIHDQYLAVHASELAAHVVKDWVRHQIKAQRKSRGDAV